MWPDRVSNPGPLTYESGALPIALRGPAYVFLIMIFPLLVSDDWVWRLCWVGQKPAVLAAVG